MADASAAAGRDTGAAGAFAAAPGQGAAVSDMAGAFAAAPGRGAAVSDMAGAFAAAPGRDAADAVRDIYYKGLVPTHPRALQRECLECPNSVVAYRLYF